MVNLTLFLNSFFSYLLLFIIVVAVVVLGVFIGITMRKKADAKEALMEEHNKSDIEAEN